MSAKIKYTDEPLGKVQVVPDFLPSPAELAFREEGVKVTLALSKKSIEFFKSEAIWNALGLGKPIEKVLFDNEKVFYFANDLGTIDKIKPIFPRIEV